MKTVHTHLLTEVGQLTYWVALDEALQFWKPGERNLQ